jgi:hypothetical protein
MKKQIGIWIDLRHAWLIDASAGIVNKLNSGIEESAATGGSRSGVAYGPQGGDMAQSAQERRHHEEQRYFEAVIGAILQTPMSSSFLVLRKRSTVCRMQ